MWKRYNFSTHLEDPGIYMCYEKISPHSSHTISSQIPSLVYNSDGTSLINSQLHCVHCFFKSPHNRPVFVAFKTTKQHPPWDVRKCHSQGRRLKYYGRLQRLWICNLEIHRKSAQLLHMLSPFAAQPNQKVQKIRIFEPENPFRLLAQISTHKAIFFVTVQLFALFFPS